MTHHPMRFALTLVLGLAAGCMSAAPMAARARVEDSVRVAKAIGADDSPGAAYHLGLARSELAMAAALMRQGAMARASDVLDRAKADAELAIALRREDEARGAAIATHGELDQLHDEALGTDGATLPAAPTPTPAP